MNVCLCKSVLECFYHSPVSISMTALLMKFCSIVQLEGYQLTIAHTYVLNLATAHCYLKLIGIML